HSAAIRMMATSNPMASSAVCSANTIPTLSIDRLPGDRRNGRAHAIHDIAEWQGCRMAGSHCRKSLQEVDLPSCHPAILPFCNVSEVECGVDDGTRTRSLRSHSPAL